MPLFLEVITPQRIVVGERVRFVVAPGIEGAFGVLENHAPLFTTLAIGTVRYEDEEGREHALFVDRGFARVLCDRVSILAESAELRGEIDFERAEQARQRAEERLADRSEEIDVARAEAALQRALHRLSLAGH